MKASASEADCAFFLFQGQAQNTSQFHKNALRLGKLNVSGTICPRLVYRFDQFKQVCHGTSSIEVVIHAFFEIRFCLFSFVLQCCKGIGLQASRAR